jgi:hypothetical protein
VGQNPGKEEVNSARKTPRFEGIQHIETYHPSAAMTFPGVRKKFEKDMSLLKSKMNEMEIPS